MLALQNIKIASKLKNKQIETVKLNQEKMDNFISENENLSFAEVYKIILNIGLNISFEPLAK